MRVVVVLLAFAVGTFSGLSLTWFASARSNGFNAVQVGAWTAWPKSGTVDADPYSRASLARAGELPLGLADGIAFEASTDNSGSTLDGRCDTRIYGRLPPARFWTITLYDARGRLIDNAAERYGFTSSEVVWNADRTVEILLAPRTRGGNWLPTGGRDRITVVLRLYEAPVGLGTHAGDTTEMPAIAMVHCP